MGWLDFDFVSMTLIYGVAAWVGLRLWRDWHCHAIAWQVPRHH